MSVLVKVSVSDEDLPVAYSCESLISNNDVTAILVEFFYDLTYQLGEREESRALLESLMVRQVASVFDLVDGDACLNPPPYGMWLVQANSDPKDQVNTLANGCVELSPEATEGCESFKGLMRGFSVGLPDEEKILEIIASGMASGTLTVGTQLRVKYLGTELASSQEIVLGRDNLRPSLSKPQELIQRARDKALTPEGIVFIVGMCLAFVGMIFAMVRRRRRSIDYYYDDESYSSEYSQSQGSAKKPADGSLGISRLNDDELVDSNHQKSFKEEMMSDGYPEEEEFKEKYAFDIGDHMKNELLGVHGNEVVRVSRLEEADLSDASFDSWAQTDATLGSLELRLESVKDHAEV